MISFRYTFILLLFHICQCEAQNVLASFTAEVGAGNYSYYKLEEAGDVTLILSSIEGDADLYISESTIHPDYINYDISSATCGKDIVTIPSTFKRPTGIGVYGHVHSRISKYKLVAVLNYTTASDTFKGTIDVEYLNEDGSGSFFSSFLWEVLETLVKILIEIIL